MVVDYLQMSSVDFGLPDFGLLSGELLGLNWSRRFHLSLSRKSPISVEAPFSETNFLICGRPTRQQSNEASLQCTTPPPNRSAPSSTYFFASKFHPRTT